MSRVGPLARRVASQIEALSRSWAGRRRGVVPFYRGRFAASVDRAAFAARNYYEGRQLEAVLKYHLLSDSTGWPARALDLGCGYGRLTPYLRDAPFIRDVYGIEPNTSACDRARELYPFAEFTTGTAQDLPYSTNYFGVAVAWTVFQHLPESVLDAAAGELARVVAPSGYLVACDETAGGRSAIVHPRTVADYQAVFSAFDLVETYSRHLEPTADHGENTLMVFKRVNE